jgi:lipopolysaccharide transport system ATP-binding protein
MTAEIEASHVSLDFPLYHGHARSLKRAVFSTVSGGRVGNDARQRVVVRALRDINFRLGRDDRLGLIGTNGAGKTTLLRILAGIYEPVEGSVRVRGSVTTLLDPQLGMSPELTGRENIMLRGLYSGVPPAAIRHLADDVADFAELGNFLDLPTRVYSSGMMVRLGFALATAVRPQVLLMDEWFLAGDAAFMERARTRLEDMVRGAEILVLSSHMLSVIGQWCKRVIWLEHGRVREDGPAAEVLQHYTEQTSDAAAVPQPVG